MCRKMSVEKSSPSHALPRQISPFVTYGDIFPRSGEVFPQRGSQAINLNAKVLSAMRKIPAVLLALPLGELAKPEALTERAYAVALSAKGVKCSKNFPAAPPLPQEAGAAAAVCRYDPFP